MNVIDVTGNVQKYLIKQNFPARATLCPCTEQIMDVKTIDYAQLAFE